MARGGKRVGAGRKPGSTTKKTREIAERAVQSGMTPLDFMLMMLRGDKISQGKGKAAYQPTIEDRKWAAAQSAAYVHPRLSSVEVERKYTRDLGDLSDAELEERINRAIEQTDELAARIAEATEVAGVPGSVRKFH